MATSDEQAVDTSKVFVGRKTERDTFINVLEEIIEGNIHPVATGSWKEAGRGQVENRSLPHIFLISGHGGIGKSELLKRLHAVAGMAAEEGLCTVPSIIPLEESGLFTIMGRGRVNPSDVIAILRSSLAGIGLGEFSAADEEHSGAVSVGDVDDNSGNVGIGHIINQIKVEAGGNAVINYNEYSEWLKNAKDGSQNMQLWAAIVALSEELRRLSEVRPLVVCLDTYELVDRVDQQLRALYLRSGPRVIWVIAGRDNLVPDRPGKDEPFRGYQGSGLGSKLHSMPLEELGVDDITTYFDEVGAKITNEQANAVYKATRGNALALAMAAKIYLKEHSLDKVIARVDSPLLRQLASREGAHGDDGLIYDMTHRLLLYCVSEQERRYLYALALVRRPDAGMLEAMMLLKAEDSLRDLLEGLESRYDFVFALKRALHDTVAYFLRAMLMEEAREGSEHRLVDELNRLACDYALSGLRGCEAGQDTKRVEQLSSDEQWQTYLVDYLHHKLWLTPNAGGELIAALACALGYNQTLARQVREIALNLRPRYTAAARQWLPALHEEEAVSWWYPNEAQLEELIGLTRRLGGREVAWHPQSTSAWSEARAVLLWQLGRIYDPSSPSGSSNRDLAKALAIYEAATQEYSSILGLHLAIAKAHHDARQYEAAAQAYSRAIEVDPERIESYHMRGVSHDRARQYEAALDDYSRAIELDQKYHLSYFCRAYVYGCQFKYEEAIAECTRAVEVKPDYKNAYRNRAIYYQRLKENEAALNDYIKVVELDLNGWQSHQELVAMYQEMSQLERGIRYYDSFIATHPNRVFGYLGRASLYRALKQFESALADCAKAVEMDPYNVLSLKELAGTYRAMDQLERGLAYYNNLIEANPKNQTAYRARAFIYAAQGLFDAAISDYPQDVMSLGYFRPSLVSIYLSIAETCLDAGQDEAAAQAYSQVIELVPDYAEHHHMRGVAYERAQQYEAALADYSRAIELDPEDYLSYQGRANLYTSVSKYTQAISDCTTLIEIRPDSESGYRARATAFTKLKQDEAALGDYIKLTELTSYSWQSHQDLVAMYQKMDQLERGITFYDEFTTAHPNNIYGYLSRAILHKALKHSEAALSDCDKAIELAPGRIDAYIECAQIRVILGQHKQAVADFTQAIALDPQSAIAYLGRGASYVVMEQEQLALSDFTHAIKIDATLGLAYKGRATLLLNENPRQALTELQRALELGIDESPDLLTLSGLAHSDLGDYRQAVADFTRAIESNFTSLPTFYGFNTTEEAMLRAISTAINNVGIPSMGWILSGLYEMRGDAYLKLRQLDKAMVDYRQAIALDPENRRTYLVLSLAHLRKKPRLDDRAGVIKKVSIVWGVIVLLLCAVIIISSLLGNPQFNNITLYIGAASLLLMLIYMINPLYREAELIRIAMHESKLGTIASLNLPLLTMLRARMHSIYISGVLAYASGGALALYGVLLLANRHFAGWFGWDIGWWGVICFIIALAVFLLPMIVYNALMTRERIIRRAK